ncbi:sulfotransferase domain-containing protein [Luedemannella flava]
MRTDTRVHFVKTHRQVGHEVDPGDKAICLVRDGRDALVSWARQVSEAEPGRFAAELRKMIVRDEPVGAGSWGANVLSWLQPPVPNRLLLRYEDLVGDPAYAVERVVTALAPQLSPRAGAVIPSFADLQQVDDQFFRRGRSSTHRDELPADLHELFWSRPDNVAAMRLVGFPPTG